MCIISNLRLFQRPISCRYKTKTYTLDEVGFHETDVHLMNGGEAFIVNLDFLNEPKNPPRLLHLYRAAKDATLTHEWQLLNAWRFLEAFHGKSDSKLKEHLVEHHDVVKETVDKYYSQYRNAAAHAAILRKKPNSSKVIVPKASENILTVVYTLTFMQCLNI